MIRQSIKRKIQSNAGASLSVALLLFLVCTVLGSIILKSGTAAAGRIAKLAENDARYYSVTSAADLLADSLDGRSVVSVRTRTTTTEETTPYTYDSSESAMKPGATVKGTPSVSYGDENGTTLWIYESDDAPSVTNTPDKTILTEAMRTAFYGGAAFQDAGGTIWSVSAPTMSDESVTNFTVNHNGKPGLTVFVTETIKPNGNIVLLVTSCDSDDPTRVAPAGSRYRMQLTFTQATSTATKSRTTTDTVISNEVKDETTGETRSFTETETTTVTDTKTTTTTWTLAEMKKVD